MEKETMKARVPFNESRQAMLKDPELAAIYLEESLQDGNMEEFKQALKHVAEARLGGMAAGAGSDGRRKD
jgi:DNA-binding phage protein